MILLFSDKEEDIFQRILQIVGNNKKFEWCDMIPEAENIQLGRLKIDLCERSVSTGKTEKIPIHRSCIGVFLCCLILYPYFLIRHNSRITF